jgi:hypothetical protein
LWWAGQTSQKATDRLQWLLSRGISGANLHKGTLVLDATTQSSVRNALGEGVASGDGMTKLVGIASRYAVVGREPAASRELDWAALGAEKHAAFILTEATSATDETAVLFAVVAALNTSIPVITVVVGGDESTVPVVQQCVKSHLPLVVVQGSGGLADELAGAGRQQFLTIGQYDPVVAYKRLLMLASSSSPTDLRRLLIGEIDRVHLLRRVWQHFARYDEGAKQHQKTYRRLRIWILALGVISTLLVVVEKLLKQQTLIAFPDLFDQGLHSIIIAIPVLVSILLAAINRFHIGTKWIVFRSCAEQIKAEIYRFRAMGPKYAFADQVGALPEELLTERVHFLIGRAAESEVSGAAIPTYVGPLPPPGSTFTPKPGSQIAPDNGLTPLSPEDYIQYRLDEQLAYYRSKTKKLQRTLQRIQWAIYIFSGVGTFLAAIEQDLWIVVATATLTALTVYL